MQITTREVLSILLAYALIIGSTWMFFLLSWQLFILPVLGIAGAMWILHSYLHKHTIKLGGARGDV